MGDVPGAGRLRDLGDCCMLPVPGYRAVWGGEGIYAPVLSLRCGTGSEWFCFVAGALTSLPASRHCPPLQSCLHCTESCGVRRAWWWWALRLPGEKVGYVRLLRCFVRGRGDLVMIGAVSDLDGRWLSRYLSPPK